MPFSLASDDPAAPRKEFISNHDSASKTAENPLTMCNMLHHNHACLHVGYRYKFIYFAGHIANSAILVLVWYDARMLVAELLASRSSCHGAGKVASALQYETQPGTMDKLAVTLTRHQTKVSSVPLLQWNIGHCGRTRTLATCLLDTHTRSVRASNIAGVPQTETLSTFLTVAR